jgi:hypothetical protein
MLAAAPFQNHSNSIRPFNDATSYDFITASVSSGIQTYVSAAKKSRSSLKEHQAIEIFELKLKNNGHKLSGTTVARSYGVTEKTVRDIWTRRTWRQETWHLDTSQSLVLKKRGRPLGSRDKQPRKPQASPCNAVVNAVESETAEEDNALGFVCLSGDVFDSFCVSGPARVDQEHGRNHKTREFSCPDFQLSSDASPLGSKLSRPDPTIDDVLFDWDLVPPVEGESVDPFHEDWPAWQQEGILSP